MAEFEEIELIAPDDKTKELTDFKWSEEKYALNDFQTEDKLPHIIRFEENESFGKISPGLKIYSKQPVLLYTSTHKKHVRARTIYRDKTGPFYEVGQTLLVPEDFEGWFELVPPDFGRGAYCRTMGEVAKVMPSKFFTRTNIRGIRIMEVDGQQEFFDRRILAGSVLRVDSIFTAKWRTTAETGLFKKSNVEFITVEEKYLKCIDIDNEEILIPLTTKGKFNIVYQKGGNDPRTVFRMKDFIDDFPMPLKVKIIYGKPPVVPCIFTGILILKTHTTDHSIIGSTVLNKRNVLFELPVNMPCEVSKVADDFSELDTYKDGFKLCERFAFSYSSMIKLSPELDTGSQMIQHIPTEKSKRPNDSLRTLDLITNISLTDDEPQDRFMDSDRESIESSGDQVPLPKGTLLELRKSRDSSAFC